MHPPNVRPTPHGSTPAHGESMVNPYFAHEPSIASTEGAADAGALGVDQAVSAARQTRDAAWLARIRDHDDVSAFEQLFRAYRW